MTWCTGGNLCNAHYQLFRGESHGTEAQHRGFMPVIVSACAM